MPDSVIKSAAVAPAADDDRFAAAYSARNENLVRPRPIRRQVRPRRRITGPALRGGLGLGTGRAAPCAQARRSAHRLDHPPHGLRDRVPEADYFALTQYSEDYDYGEETVWMTYWHRPCRTSSTRSSTRGSAPRGSLSRCPRQTLQRNCCRTRTVDHLSASCSSSSKRTEQWWRYVRPRHRIRSGPRTGVGGRCLTVLVGEERSIEDMSGSDLLDHVGHARPDPAACEVQILLAAVQHAILNNAETMDPWQAETRAASGRGGSVGPGRRRWRSSRRPSSAPGSACRRTPAGS